MKAALKRVNYAIARRLVRLLAKPTVNSTALERRDMPPGEIVYVLPNRSLADVVLLDVVAEEHGMPSPLSPVPEFDEDRRFFFLNRPAGWRRRITMRETSPRMRRFEVKLAEGRDAPLLLVPVSIFWGRAANKDRSWMRALFSEGWAVSSRLRRSLILVFNRRDVLVHFGEPMHWHQIVLAQGSERFATRRTARLLRVHFRNQKVAALGPDLSHRRTLVEQILASSQVSRAVDAAVAEGADPKRVERNARNAAYAIASDVSYPIIRFLDRLLTWFWHRIYDGLAVTGVENFEALAETHTLIYVPCHRSHVDYLVLSYVLFHRGFMLPHVASGDNLDMPLVGRLLRGGGAFFMRRHFVDDTVYSAVFSEYLYQVFRRGHCVEYFVEGGRSRTGRLLPAHTGMLRMTIEAHERGLPRPIAFVPVYLGYEKIIEANAYLAELRGGTKQPETVGGVLRSLRLVRQSFGAVQVSFGKPIELEPFLDGRPHDQVARTLGARILAAVNACAFVNSVNLVALATLAMPRQAIDEETLRSQIDLYRELVERHSGHHDYRITGTAVDEIISHVEGLGLLHREPGAGPGDAVTETSDILSHDPFTSLLMTWYRNNVLHVVAAPSLIACLVTNRRSIRRVDLHRLFDVVHSYIADELPTLAEDPFDRWLRHLRDAELVELRRGTVVASADPMRRFRLRLLANAIMPVLERFYITLAVLNRAGSGMLDHDSLSAECRTMATRFSKLYGIDSPEFADARLFAAFLGRLAENGVVTADPKGRLIFDERVPQVLRAGRSVIAMELRLALERRHPGR